MPERVAVLGASPKPERYSNQAVALLKEHGHQVYAVSPAGDAIHGCPGHKTLAEIAAPLDTITVYLGPANATPLIPAILAARPQRIILNPGAENAELSTQAQAHGIAVLEACTLVMLRTGQY